MNVRERERERQIKFKLIEARKKFRKEYSPFKDLLDFIDN